MSAASGNPSALTTGSPTTNGKRAKPLPGPKANGLRVALTFRRAPLDFLRGLLQRYGDVVSFKLLNLPIVLVNDPAQVKRVFREEHGNYARQSRIYKLVRALFGNAIVLAPTDDSWLRRRRLVQPAFHHSRIAALSTVMTDAANAALDRWEPLAKAGRTVDVHQEMSRLALSIVARSFFAGVADDTSIARFAQAARVANSSFGAFVRFPLLPLSVPTPGHRRFWRNRRIMYEIIDDAIRQAERRPTHEDGSERIDILSMFMEAQDADTGARMSRDELREEMVGMLFAGHDTTALVMTWLLYLLSRHPEVEQRLCREVDEVLGGRTVTIADLPKLPYLKAVMEETLRLYPPTWELFRLVTRDHQFGEYRLRAGHEVMVSPYFVHRHPDFWEDPERFDPDRFAPDRAARRDRAAYIPFGSGPHMCVGNAFAQTEIQLVLASTVQRYRLVQTTDTPVEPKPLLTTSPGRPVLLRLQRR